MHQNAPVCFLSDRILLSQTYATCDCRSTLLDLRTSKINSCFSPRWGDKIPSAWSQRSPGDSADVAAGGVATRRCRHRSTGPRWWALGRVSGYSLLTPTFPLTKSTSFARTWLTFAYLSAPNQVADRGENMAVEEARSRSPDGSHPPSRPPPGRHDASQLIHYIKTTFGTPIITNLCLIWAFSGDWAHLAPVYDKHSINVMAGFLPWWLKSLHSFVNNIPMTAERVFWRQLVQIGCHLAS